MELGLDRLNKILWSFEKYKYGCGSRVDAVNNQPVMSGSLLEKNGCKHHDH
jgi:hypothetical protein